MISRTIKQLFAAASVGSAILVSAVPVNAGRMFKDEPSRPHTFAGCQPAWGYNQTCWQRFPALPPCDSNGNCYGQPSDGMTQFVQSGGVYVPQNDGVAGAPGFSAMPHSQVPGQTATRMLVPNAETVNGPTEFQYGSQLNGPAIPVPMQQYSVPPQTLQPLESLEEQPSQQVPPAPNGTPALPPLPSPPEALPAASGQTHLQPRYEQLMIGADGRLTTATAMNRNQVSSAGTSRYGQINRPVTSQPGTVPSTQRRTGPPVHFADAVASAATQRDQSYSPPAGTASRQASVNNSYSPRTLAKPVAHSQNTQTTSSSRYGAVRPATTATVAPTMSVEPLRKTPGSYR